MLLFRFEVLMVAEKPSVARLVSDFLRGDRQRLRERRGTAVACPVLEFVAVPWHLRAQQLIFEENRKRI